MSGQMDNKCLLLLLVWSKTRRQDFLMHVEQVAYLHAVRDGNITCTCEPYKLHVKNS